jgi:aryl-alcohol dehydrogenase-like predicted oxidoreductase
MKRRRLGGEGLLVSELGLGCVGISELYGPRELDESRAAIELALDIGIDFFDTSDIYGSGHNEAFLGEVLGPRRHQALIATKFGAVRTPDGLGYVVNGRPDHVVAACERSLERLGIERIDLYYQHRVDPETPIEETVGAMSALAAAGKIRCLGLCECSAATLRRAHAVHPISAVQVEYSLFSREAERELLPACRELGVGLVAYSPLSRGLLTGRIQSTDGLSPFDYRRIHPRFRDGNLDKNLDLVRRLELLAREKRCTAAQLALAWLLHGSEAVVPIPGTKRRRHLQENAGASELELTNDEWQRIAAAVPAASVSGGRYDPGELSRVGL